MRTYGWIILATAFLGVGACGGSDTVDATGSEGGETPAAEEAKEMTPSELGEKAGEMYIQALGELVDLMQDRPAAEELRPEVEALKERTVTKLVELGKKREALDSAGQASFDSSLRMGIRNVPSEVFTAYAEGQRHYIDAGANDLAKMIGDFNVITQYANFELLKKQAPKEAERLGIE